MKTTILTDSADSWFVPYGRILKSELEKRGCDVSYVFQKQDITKGDVCFLLSCTKLVDEKSLALNAHNIVVHASDLPQGRGFSPLQWQILEGKNKIVLTLFEAVKEVDAGSYYVKSAIDFEGHELHDELRERLARKIIEMCVRYVADYSKQKPIPQEGSPSFYPRRTAKDDELDVRKTLAEQFNHLRIADNERFPLRFSYLGHTYVLTIRKEKEKT